VRTPGDRPLARQSGRAVLSAVSFKRAAPIFRDTLELRRRRWATTPAWPPVATTWPSPSRCWAPRGAEPEYREALRIG
jgi:hypothetical protein